MSELAPTSIVAAVAFAAAVAIGYGQMTMQLSEDSAAQSPTAAPSRDGGSRTDDPIKNGNSGEIVEVATR